MTTERGFDEIIFQAGDDEPQLIYKSLKMRENYGAVLRDGPIPEVWYETGYGHARVCFTHTPQRPHRVRIRMDDEFAYEDLVEFMSFFTVLSGWLGRSFPEPPEAAPED